MKQKHGREMEIGKEEERGNWESLKEREKPKLGEENFCYSRTYFNTRVNTFDIN